MITIEKFNKWFESARIGDKIVYYKGSLARDVEESKGSKKHSELNKLREHVMDHCANWIIEAHSCTLKMVDKVDLFQKKIQAYVHSTLDDKRIDEVYEYIAVKK